MNNNKKRKICFAASSGGHFEQLMMLKPLMEKYNSFIITEKTKYNSSETRKTYYMKQVNRRELSFIFKMIYNMLKSFVIFLKERPDAVICTGVLAVIPICIISKVFRKKAYLYRILCKGYFSY